MVELIRIRTLAEAGVPLVRVRELLQADGAEFAAAVADIDRLLEAEIQERKRHRARIARLTSGDGLALPPQVVAFLDRLRALGIDERLADEHGEEYVGDPVVIEPVLAELMDALAFDTVPSARRLIELLKQRGWDGWTTLQRVHRVPRAPHPPRPGTRPSSSAGPTCPR